MTAAMVWGMGRDHFFSNNCIVKPGVVVLASNPSTGGQRQREGLMLSSLAENNAYTPASVKDPDERK